MMESKQSRMEKQYGCNRLLMEMKFRLLWGRQRSPSLPHKTDLKETKTELKHFSHKLNLK